MIRTILILFHKLPLSKVKEWCCWPHCVPLVSAERFDKYAVLAGNWPVGTQLFSWARRVQSNISSITGTLPYFSIFLLSWFGIVDRIYSQMLKYSSSISLILFSKTSSSFYLVFTRTTPYFVIHCSFIFRTECKCQEIKSKVFEIFWKMKSVVSQYI